MKTTIGLLFIVLAIGVTSCTSGFTARRSKEITPQFLSSIQRFDTTDQIVYFGSDTTFHYFQHYQLFGGDSYKISRAKLKLSSEFPISAGREPVMLWDRFDEKNGSWRIR